MWNRLSNFFGNIIVIPAIATFYLLDQKVIAVRSTTGKSMQPTISENSIVVVDKIFYKLLNNNLKQGDIVVATQPTDPKTFICKRVIETGGNYLPEHPTLKVPAGNLWLQGDNKTASYDSRHHGCVPEHLVEGKVIFSLAL